MKIVFTVFLLLFNSLAYANGLVLEDIKAEQINELLPSNWKVSDIKNVESPVGWSKISGDTGVQITLSRTPYSYKPAITKSGDFEVYHPKFIFCIMPNNFSGESGNGALFKNGKVDTPENMLSRAMLILKNIKQLGHYYIFYIDTSFEDWKNPEELFDEILTKKYNL